MKSELKRIGQDLLRLLERGVDPSDIASWAEREYAQNTDRISQKHLDIIDSISMMDLGPEYQMSSSELTKLAEQFIEFGEADELLSYDPTNLDSAIQIDQQLLCPKCSELWTLKDSDIPVLRCPACKLPLSKPRDTSAS